MAMGVCGTWSVWRCVIVARNNYSIMHKVYFVCLLEGTNYLDSAIFRPVYLQQREYPTPLSCFIKTYLYPKRQSARNAQEPRRG
jgi:hypothetical protein